MLSEDGQHLLKQSMQNPPQLEDRSEIIINNYLSELHQFSTRCECF